MVIHRKVWYTHTYNNSSGGFILFGLATKGYYKTVWKSYSFIGIFQLTSNNKFHYKRRSPPGQAIIKKDPIPKVRGYIFSRFRYLYFGKSISTEDPLAIYD